MKIVSSISPAEEIQQSVREEFPDIDFYFYKGMEQAEADLHDAEVFITYGEDLTDAHIEKAVNLKWIMVMSAGMELMPFAACKKKDILITNARGIHKIPMAEYTIGTMLNHVKNTFTLLKNEELEIWDRKVPIDELNGKTLLILGVGAIGGEIARLASAFRMNTIGINRSGQSVDYIDQLYKIDELEHVLPQADFIVSILPSTNETKYLLKEKHFDLMKETAVFINIGRGDLVEEEVLLTALENKQIAHAYLDVFFEEPLRKGHPFWKMPNVTVTPHLSSKSKEYLPRSFDIFKQNLHTYVNNEKNYINEVDVVRGY